MKRRPVIHHAWLIERDYDDPHRGQMVALGPDGADTAIVAALLRGEGAPFVLRDKKKCPLYSGRFLADLREEDSEFGDAPLTEFGLELGAHRIDYDHTDTRPQVEGQMSMDDFDRDEVRFKRLLEAQEAEAADKALE